MRKVIMSMMMSLDGFIAGPNDEMDWLPDFKNEELWEEMHAEMWKQLRTVDTILLGRLTYQIWERYWPAAATDPSSTKNDIEFSRYADETPKVVFSKTLDNVKWQNTRLIKDNIAEEIAKMKQRPGKDLALAGGAGIAQTFTNLGLIDRYRLLVHPVVLGKGKPLFKDIKTRIKLRLVNMMTYKNGVVGLDYEPDR